ncbi:MAG: hypothetical protein ACI8RZ_002972 [Myxococcota bacterium]|jgi:hypothetical protein
MGSGILSAITDLMSALGIELEPWMGPVFALTMLILLLPWILKNMRTSSARKMLKKATLEGGEKRAEMERSAITMVADNPEGLMALAEECMRRGRYVVAREALRRIPEDDIKRQRQRKHMLKEMVPRQPETPEAAALMVERLREEGLAEEANHRLSKAQRRWPESPILTSLVGGDS